MAGPQALGLGLDSADQDAQRLHRDLLNQRSLDGLNHEFIVRCGCIWQELQAIISEKQIGRVVVGTHGRRGLEKLILGSVAEEVFRDAEAPFLAWGLTPTERRVWNPPTKRSSVLE